MATTKIKLVLKKALEKLVDEELDQFIWHLWNPEGFEPILRSKLQNANCRVVADCMISQYTANAGNIAVQVLRCMEQNDLANDLQQKLLEVLQSEPVDRSNASMSVEDQPIQSDWKRPHSITHSSQQFKNTVLSEKGNDVYVPKDKSQRKRSALLITNIKFNYEEYNRTRGLKYLKYRAGAERDEENMEWLLTALGYSVEKHTNLTGQEIAARVRNFAAHSEHQDSDSTFVVLMSHGDIIHNKDAILGVDYDEVKNPNDFFFVDEIFSHLNSEKCPALTDKPKVILIQACRGEHPGAVQIQSDSAVQREKDFVCFKSCLPGISAYRDPDKGSFFICYIVDVFCNWAHNDDIMELFRKVTLRMEKDPRFKHLEIRKDELAKLMPCIDRTSLPKKLYLFPGL